MTIQPEKDPHELSPWEAATPVLALVCALGGCFSITVAIAAVSVGLSISTQTVPIVLTLLFWGAAVGAPVYLGRRGKGQRQSLDGSGEERLRKRTARDQQARGTPPYVSPEDERRTKILLATLAAAFISLCVLTSLQDFFFDRRYQKAWKPYVQIWSQGSASRGHSDDHYLRAPVVIIINGDLRMASVPKPLRPKSPEDVQSVILISDEERIVGVYRNQWGGGSARAFVSHAEVRIWDLGQDVISAEKSFQSNAPPERINSFDGDQRSKNSSTAIDLALAWVWRLRHLPPVQDRKAFHPGLSSRADPAPEGGDNGHHIPLAGPAAERPSSPAGAAKKQTTAQKP